MRSNLTVKGMRKGPERKSNFVQSLGLSIGVAAIVLPLAILCWQSYERLNLGSWPPLSAGDVWTGLGRQIPLSSFSGVQQIIDWVFDLPAAVAIFFLGTSISLLVMLFANWHPMRGELD